jgi:hypothetical protein
MRLIGFGLAIGLALAPLPGVAQRARIPRIGVLDGTSASNPRTCVQFLRRGLSELGYLGGLVSYGASFGDLFRRATTHVDEILRGRLRVIFRSSKHRSSSR